MKYLYFPIIIYINLNKIKHSFPLMSTEYLFIYDIDKYGNPIRYPVPFCLDKIPLWFKEKKYPCLPILEKRENIPRMLHFDSLATKEYFELTKHFGDNVMICDCWNKKCEYCKRIYCGCLNIICTHTFE